MRSFWPNNIGIRFIYFRAIITVVADPCETSGPSGAPENNNVYCYGTGNCKQLIRFDGTWRTPRLYGAAMGLTFIPKIFNRKQKKYVYSTYRYRRQYNGFLGRMSNFSFVRTLLIENFQGRV